MYCHMGISRKCYCSVCVCMFRTTMMKNTLRTKYYHFPYLPVIHNHWWGFPWKLYLFSYFHVKYVLPYACDRKICLMVFHILVGDPSDISKAMFYKKRKRATYNKKRNKICTDFLGNWNNNLKLHPLNSFVLKFIVWM